ncbi:type I secretion system permease/ATPase [Propionivibrio sp.]|uniref:type I secretion system permease/ATPase n=1 Tax=Propionivibrio sp. TaxID=2212460 RepID=UPI003BF25F48
MELIPKSLRERLLTPEIRRTLFYVMGLSMVINILLLTSPLYMLQMYDRVLTSRSEETLLAISAIALFLLAGFGALEVMRSRALVGIGLAIDERINEGVFTSLFREAVNRGQGLSAQPVRDLEMVRGLVSGHSLTALFDLPWAPFFILLIFVMHPVLGALALAGAVVSIFLAVISERISRPLVGDTSRHQMAASRFVDACLRNVDAIHANGMLRNMRARWLDSYSKSVELGAVGADRVSAFSGTTKAFRIIMQSVMLGCGAWLVLKDASVSPGVMVAASIIFGRAIAPLDQSIAASKGFISGLMAMKRLDALLSRHERKGEPMALPRPKGTLKVEDLALVPAGGRKPVLSGINFTLEAGEVLAVVGPSASGKSSLARALVGLWPPANGKVRFDGADLAQWEPDALGKFIGYLPQDVELLVGTVKENIGRFGAADAEDVLKAAEQAGCHELVLNLPEGYDTVIGEGGNRLSGGQSQRVALARCYFGNPALVVLDEPDSNLDIEGVAALDAALARMKARGTTAILITHNVRLLRHADKALMLANGGMAYFGPPRELIEKLSKRAA